MQDYATRAVERMRGLGRYEDLLVKMSEWDALGLCVPLHASMEDGNLDNACITRDLVDLRLDKDIAEETRARAEALCAALLLAPEHVRYAFWELLQAAKENADV